MSHFALINDQDKVEEVIVAEQDFIDTLEGEWVKTSYNTHGGVHIYGGTPLRMNYAGIGFTYDRVKDAFIPLQPFASWVLNNDTCLWEAPIPYPDDGNIYEWNEDTVSWVELV
jgi:hypothetical protein